jgi:hypothetical protein
MNNSSDLEKYFEGARHRAQRRKSPWNLILIPFAIAGMALCWWLLALPIFHFRQSGMSDSIFLSGGTRAGLILFYVGLGFCSIGPGFLIANAMTWFIPPARKIFDREAIGHKGTDFKSACRGLIKFSMIILIVLYPISFLAGMNYFALNQEKIFYRKALSAEISEYRWDQVKRIETMCYSKKSAGEGKFILVFDDGASINLFEAMPKNFFPAYPKISAALKNVSYDFIHQDPPKFYKNKKCLPSWMPYFSERPS